MFFHCAVLITMMAALIEAGPPETGGFGYSVNDFNGNEQSHQQTRVGNGVKGQYKVLLPDGRLQTVTYIADEGGYRAKVDYTPALPGEATTAGKGLIQPAAPTAPISPIGDPTLSGPGPAAFVNGGAAYGARSFMAGPYTGGAYGVGPVGVGAFSPGLLEGSGGYGGFGGGAFGYGVGNIGYGVGGSFGYSYPILGGLGYKPVGYSTGSPTGYSYGYTTPYSQVYSYSNFLGGLRY